MSKYYITSKNGVGEYIEKKSRFIGQSFPIESEDEAIKIIEETKKKYWDARHNCYAFCVGKNSEIMRFSDDGEPSGTAGKPILEVLTRQNIHNTLVVVTRYFGGTLLGTGGLVRAYSKATSAAVKDAGLTKVCPGFSVSFNASYEDYGKIKNLIMKSGITKFNEEYSDKIKIDIEMPADIFDSFKSEVVDITSGKVTLEDAKNIEYIEKI